MKLDRNIQGNEGRGKYALILLRKLALFDDGKTFGGLAPNVRNAITTLDNFGLIDWGNAGTESEFFVIRLKDKNAAQALEAYANEAGKDDPQFADEVRELVDRAGPKSAWCKNPD